jgi:uncharacterized membrane protein
MFETEVDVDATPEDVWAVLVDVERWPEWTASMSEVRMVEGGPLAVGARVRIKQPRLPATVWEVTSLAPLDGFTWTAVAPGVTTVAEHRMAQESRGRVKVTLGIRRSGPLAPVVDALFSRLTRRYVQMEAEGLKRRCEAPS